MKRTFFIRAAIATAVLCCGLSALAQRQMPTDVDLKSAYCVGVLQTGIARLGSYPPSKNPDIARVFQQARDDLVDALNRLKGYLVPRLNYLDVTGLAIATNRGKIDYEKSSVLVQACIDRCPVTDLDQGLSCMLSCKGNDPVNARVDACNKPDFLPF